MTPMEFDDVIAPIPRETFLSSHWGKSFLRLPGKSGRFSHLLTWDDLNAIVEQNAVGPPRLRLAQDGRALEPGLYTRPGMGGQQCIDTGKLASCLAGGATLIVERAEDLAPRVRDISDAFREALHAGNYVNLYAGWHSQNGFDLHWDSQDVMILQLAGRKRWKLYAPTRASPLENDIESPSPPPEPPAWDGMLEDGDALYIPRGWWHVAYPVDEPSLHLTVASVPPNGADLLQWLVGRLRRHVEVRTDLPFLDDTVGQANRLKQLRALLLDEMDENCVSDFRRQWEGDTFPRAHIDLRTAPYSQLAPITESSTVRLTAAHKLTFTPAGENLAFSANGMLFVLAGELAPAMAMLTDVRAVKFSDLAAEVTGQEWVANLRTSLETLAGAGVILIDKA